MRKYLVKCAYLVKGVVEGLLGDFTRGMHPHSEVVVNTPAGKLEFPTMKSYEEYRRTHVANGDTQH
jgi:hypothetical protein